MGRKENALHGQTRSTNTDHRRHLQRVHVRTQVKQDSKAKGGNQGLEPDINPDYCMDEDLWNSQVVSIFENASAKRSKRGSKIWLQNETAFYQKIWEIILPNEPMPESPCEYLFS